MARFSTATNHGMRRSLGVINARMLVARIVVVGGSQGGIRALSTLIGDLPAKFSAPILIVQHIGAFQSILPAILNDVDGERAAFARHGEELQDYRIYIAPPDHHMLVNDGRLELTRGPRENWARPAIDPLFRSAAQYYGPDAIGIILSGKLNDGTAGLFEIKRQGGVAIVQTPGEAEAPDMPQSALANVAVDYCIPVAEMPRLLLRLTDESAAPRRQSFDRITAMPEEQAVQQPTAQTCPECGGAMHEESAGSLIRFRCHIGHVMTAEVLAATQLERLNNELSAVQRALNERAELCREIADKRAAKGDAKAARLWRLAAVEAQQREEITRQLTEAEWVRPEAEAEAEAENKKEAEPEIAE